MKRNIYIILILLMTGFIVACDDDSDLEAFGTYSIDINGVSEIEPGNVETYYIGDLANIGTYTWTVTGPAKIINGVTTGPKITVQFLSVGDVEVIVSNGIDSNGKKAITVIDVEPAVDAVLGGSGFLKSGKADTVFLNFPAPLAGTPSIKMLASTDTSVVNYPALAFTSGSLGPIVKVSDSKYYAIYTAGGRTGTPEALITGLQTTATFGSVKIDSTYIELFTVDNTPPTATLEFSDYRVKNGAEVTLTFTFSEPVNFEKSVLVTFSGAGVAVETDTLVATEDPLVYTYVYTANGGGNGTVYAELDWNKVTDFAGNELINVFQSDNFVIDNIAPTITGFATDEGAYASISPISNGSTDMYLILKSDKPAPVTVNEFLAGKDAISSGTFGNTPLILTLNKGSYVVYFLTVDAANNYSTITNVALVMD